MMRRILANDLEARLANPAHAGLASALRQIVTMTSSSAEISPMAAANSVWKRQRLLFRLLVIKNPTASDTLLAFLEEPGLAEEANAIWRLMIMAHATEAPAQDQTIAWLTEVDPHLVEIRESLLAMEEPVLRERLQGLSDDAVFANENTATGWNSGVGAAARDESSEPVLWRGTAGQPSRSLTLRASLHHSIDDKNTGYGHIRFPILIGKFFPERPRSWIRFAGL